MSSSFSSSAWKRVLVLLLLSTITTARVPDTKRDDSLSQGESWWPWSSSRLLARQVDDGYTAATMNSDCLWLCELGTCGSSKTCGLYEKRKRSLHPFDDSLNPYQAWNDTTNEWDVVSEDEYAEYKRSVALDKRTFDYAPRWSGSRLDKYSVECDNQKDSQFVEYFHIMNGAEDDNWNEGTRSSEVVFANQVGKPF
ncbi:hypothetical protein QBC46DRAFT_344762 [Diplogelasinospora grovesii]|uniref:Uncharacterized protein n=1 Tax=Diplogelasinospora grovesii TaxID=303347 RepID=A0AAN6N191_9PEZI|nr:hypothetical protein QBC46DRAFT_344762 [Diplogelasinospora grovesii]